MKARCIEAREWSNIRSWVKRRCKGMEMSKWFTPACGEDGRWVCLVTYPDGDCAMWSSNGDVIHGRDHFVSAERPPPDPFLVRETSFVKPEGYVRERDITEHEHCWPLTMLADWWWRIKYLIMDFMSFDKIKPKGKKNDKKQAKGRRPRRRLS